MSVSQISFFQINAADYTNQNVLVTASQGNEYAPFVQRRSNFIGWMTTDSVDADNTTLTCDFVDFADLTDIILVGHNFKNFNIKYWDGAMYVDFSTPISVSGSTDTVTRFSFTLVSTTKIQLTILGTQVVDADKRLNQLIATKFVGQFNGWPKIQKPEFDLNKVVNTMLSGKSNIGVNVGGFKCKLSVSNWSNASDLTLVETLYGSSQGFLVWLSGGIETQFRSVRQGYRKKDLFLMRCQDNYEPEYVQGLYQSGLSISMNLLEVTT